MISVRTVRPYARLGFLVVFLVALVGLGYLGFVAFVKGVMRPGEFGTYGLLVTTLAAATASFFSPCSFTVLPGYLAFASSGSGAGQGGLRSALKSGVVAALGVLAAVTIIGALIGVLGTGIEADLRMTGSNPSPAAQALRIAVGAFILGMGVLHLTGLSNRLPLLGGISTWAIRLEGDGSPWLRSFFLYGAGYVLVGIGCVGPFLAAVAAFALATGGFLTALAVFVLFAAVLGLFMLVISLLVGMSQNAILSKLRTSTHKIQRVAGALLVVVGIGLIYFSLDTGAFQSIFIPS